MFYLFIFIFSCWTYADTLSEVKERGYLRCGIHEGLTGFSSIDRNGNRSGFDVDFCRAISSAIFNDPQKVKFITVNTKTRFLSLSSKKVDVLARNTTQTFDRDTALGISFSAINFYDGQGFMVPKKYTISDVSDLHGATICVIPGTTTELNLADYFSLRNIAYKPVVVESLHQAMVAYEQNRCDAFTSDYSSLHINKALLQHPEDHVILDQVISKEPLALAVPAGDENWRKLVSWVIWGTLQAEELGVHQTNIDQALNSSNPKIKRLLGSSPLSGANNIGLDPFFMTQVLKHIGNYADIFDRNLTPLGLKRGLNKPWTEGGLFYAPPMR
ncbi:amino acid ABC transporter substrate-binding protein [Gammaproteobacteria bacterium]|nr:amino acid ABC transporter substrate-binding protein [Gammaproteobacteria bacterium]